MLSEQAGESRNKLYKQDREHHARKTNRKANLLDVFNRAMDSSDPVISDYSLVSRREMKKKLPLPSAALDLLLVPDEPEPLVARQLDFDDEDVDEEDQDDDAIMDVAGNVVLEMEEILDDD
jgi:hypothetical protein